MFIEINGLAYNLMFAQSIDKLDEDGKYKILYAISNENKLVEEFDNEADRDAKYELAQEASSTAGIKEEIEQIEQDIQHLQEIGFHPLVVEELPEDPEEFILYLVPSEDSDEENIYNEFLYINGEWEQVGTTGVDLSNYYTKGEVNSLFRKVTGFINLHNNSSNNPLVLSTLEPGMYIVSNDTWSGASFTMVARPGNRSTTIFDFDLNRFACLFIENKIPEVYDNVRRSVYLSIKDADRSGVYIILDDGYSLTQQWNLSKELLTTSTSQTITSKKTFNKLPESSVTPTTNNQLVNKKYVDDSVAGVNDLYTVEINTFSGGGNPKLNTQDFEDAINDAYSKGIYFIRFRLLNKDTYKAFAITEAGVSIENKPEYLMYYVYNPVASKIALIDVYLSWSGDTCTVTELMWRDYYDLGPLSSDSSPVASQDYVNGAIAIPTITILPEQMISPTTCQFTTEQRALLDDDKYGAYYMVGHNIGLADGVIYKAKAYIENSVDYIDFASVYEASSIVKSLRGVYNKSTGEGTFSIHELLTTSNTTSYTPSEDYHPATKKYVDDTVAPIQDLSFTLTSITYLSSVDQLGKSVNAADQAKFLEVFKKLYNPSNHQLDKTFDLYMFDSAMSSQQTIKLVGMYAYILSNRYICLGFLPIHQDGGSMMAVSSKLGWVAFNFDTSIVDGEIQSFNNATYYTYAELGGYLSKTNTKSYTPSQDYHPATKKYVDDNKGQTIQYSTMPTADSTTVGKVVQFTGTTDSTYTNGYFYIGTEDNSTYSWEQLDVQPSGGSAAPIFVLEDNSNYNTNDNKQVILDIIAAINNGVGPVILLHSRYQNGGWSSYPKYYYLAKVRSISSSNIILSADCGVSTSHQTSLMGVTYNNAESIWVSANYSNDTVTSVTTGQNDAPTPSLYWPDASPIAWGNTTAFTPTGDYNLVHKKYVDDAISGVSPIVGVTHSRLGTDATNSWWVHTYQVNKEITDAAMGSLSSLIMDVFNDCLPHMKGVNLTHLLRIHTINEVLIEWKFGNTTDWKPAGNDTRFINVFFLGKDFIGKKVISATANYTSDGAIESWYSFTLYSTTLNALGTNNTVSYTPTNSYHPATKKYVDDAIAAAITNALGGSY